MFVFLPLMYFWCRDPMHYPIRIRSSILCVFLLTVVVPSYDLSTLSTRSSVSAGESEWDPNPLESDDNVSGTQRSRMREGTRIGSTMGKFYRNGRRWVFEYALPPELQADLANTSSQQNLKEVREVVTTPTDRLTSSISTVTKSSTATTTSSSTRDTTTTSPAPPVVTQVVRIRVLENLALQRIATAISEDSNDIYWTVTGTVTEFGNENWLLLTTTLRSPSGIPE